MTEERDKGTEIKRTNSNPNEVPTLVTTAPFPCQNISSSSSVKLKKSSNIFSAFVRKARRKKTASKSSSEGVKNLHPSSQNLSGSSTLSLAAHIEEEVELSCQNYEKKCSQNQEILWESRGACSETSQSEMSNLNKTTRNIFSLRDNHSCQRLFKDDMAQTSHNRTYGKYEERDGKSMEPEYLNESSQDEGVVSSFINFGKPTLDIAHADALQYLQEVINNFHESEDHIVNLLIKYITDHNVQKEMRNAISNHTKLQWEAERRSCSLANDIWMQQVEIGRAQEKILQGTLHSLVKQNRQLQIENESLYRKYEKANKLLKGYSDHKSRYHECDSQMDAVLRHNEKLQTKLESLFKKIESLECELHIFQKQNDSLEDQLRNSTVKLQNMKATFHKLKTDYDIEQASLNFEIDSKKQILKEAFEIGDIVLEDLDGLKRQLKNLPFALNWAKFKVRGNCLTDLIHICRSCINELSKELITVHTEVTMKEKDLITLRESNKNLHENFKKTLSELDDLVKKNEEYSVALKDKQMLEEKCRNLEGELKNSKEDIDRVKAHYEGEKQSLLQNAAAQDKYVQELEDKDKIIEQTKLVVASITTENYSLQNKIVSLNRLINETGAGDIVREMEHKHEELEFFRTELEKLREENSQLKMHMNTSQNENHSLMSKQELTFKALQRQVKELERLNEDNQNLRHQLENEHKTVSSLQGERMKYLEEKSILKSVIQHLKAELSKIRELEDNLSNVTKEASKLGLIAEYNQQQGEKLKQEIRDRDNTITQLRNSMQKFNDIQMQNAKEKLTLCYELNEVSQLKERLSEVLNSEVKKNAELGQSKEAIVKSVHSQIQKIEEKQRNERTAMRILLRDIKVAAEEKEDVLKQKNKLEREIEQLKTKLSEQDEKYNIVAKDLKLKNEEIKELRKEIDRYEKANKESSEKLGVEASKYESNLKQLKRLIEQLRSEKKDLENSNGYLKNNMEKLHKDLDESRQSEKITTDALNRLKQEQEDIKRLLTEKTEEVARLNKENDNFEHEKYQLFTERNSLMKQVDCLNELMDKIVIDFEKNMKTAEDKEKMFKEELDESKEILYSYEKQIQNLTQSVELKEKRIDELKDIRKIDEVYEKRCDKLKEEKEQLEKDHAHIKETKAEMETQLCDLQEEHNKLTIHIIELEKESSILESQLKIVLDQKEEDYMFYKKHIAEISRAREELGEQYQKEIVKLRSQLQDVTNRLDNEKTAYETLSQIHKDISGKFMRSIKDLVDAKNSRQDILDKVREDKIKLENVENDKTELKRQMRKLSENLELSIQQLQQKDAENAALQTNYAKTLEKCILLENQVKEMEINQHKHYREIDHATSEDDSLQDELERLRNELEDKFTTIHQLRMEISELQKQITLLQLEKSDVTLKLHETEKKLETEKHLGEQLKNTQKLLLASVMQLKDEGKVDSSDCIHLLHMVRSTSHLSVDSTKTDS